MLHHELDRLKHRDVRQRRMAVRRLFEIGDPAALSAFVELLDCDDDWFVDKAIDAIRRWVETEHRKVVVALSVRQEERLRLLAAELAPRLDSEALPILSTLCSDRNQSVRREAWKSRLRVDAGTIPVAIESEDYIIRKLAISRSGDTDLLEKMLSDTHLRVQQAALEQMIKIGHQSSILDPLLDGPHRLKVANIRLPELIKSKDTDIIAQLCRNPDAAMRKTLAAHLDEADWLSWENVVSAARESSDPLLFPRLLRSRKEPRAAELRLSLLQDGNDISRARILEHLHGRSIPESIADLLPSLAKDSDPVVAQAASSLMADAGILGAGI